MTRSEDSAVDRPVKGEVTELLQQGRDADRQVLDRLVHLVYEELRHMAHRRLSTEPTGHTLDTSALVHEAYLKLVDQTRVTWRNRSHFLAVASTAMRRILVDHARRHLAGKRGGGNVRVPLDSAQLAVEDRAGLLLELDGALNRLEDVDPRLRKVVEYRFFGGMTEAEAAEVLGITARTVRSDWRSISEESGWLGDRRTGAVAPFGDYDGDRTRASWLPSAEAAQRWSAFVSPGRPLNCSSDDDDRPM